MYPLRKDLLPEETDRRDTAIRYHLLHARITEERVPQKTVELGMVKNKTPEPMKEIFKDKNGFYSMREMVTALFVVITVISWISTQFFGIPVPEYMFYSFISIIGAGCFGYTFEKKITNQKSEQE